MEIAVSVLAVAVVVFGTGVVLPGPVLPTGLRTLGSALAVVMLCVHIRDRGWLTGIDRPLAAFLGTHRNVALDPFVHVCAEVTGPAIVAVGAAVSAVVMRRRASSGAAVLLVAGVVAAGGAGGLLGLASGQAHLAPEPPLLGFESSLSTAALAAFAALVGMGALVIAVGRPRRTQVAVALAAVLVIVAAACSRLYLGVDQLTSVVAAAMIGAMVVTAGARLLLLLATGGPPRHSAVTARRHPARRGARTALPG